MTRWVFGCLGLLAAIVIIGISTAMNYQFGATWGTTPQAQILMGATFASFDILLALLPFAIYAAWLNGRWFALVCAVPFGVLLVSLSFMSAIGFTSTNRADVLGEARLLSAEISDRERELEHLIERRGFIPSHRPLGVIAADLSVRETLPRWKATNGCTNATAKASVRWCQDYVNLRQEMAAADERKVTDEEVRLVRNELRRLRSSGQASTGGRDVQAEALGLLVRVATVPHRTTASPAFDPQLWLPILIAIAVVASNIFGLPLVLSFLGRPPLLVPRSSNNIDRHLMAARAPELQDLNCDRQPRIYKAFSGNDVQQSFEAVSGKTQMGGLQSLHVRT